jgi:hypothetical protein
MLTHPTLDQLRALRLDGMADAFVELQSQDNARDLSHAEWLALLLDREAARRDTRRSAVDLGNPTAERHYAILPSPAFFLCEFVVANPLNGFTIGKRLNFISNLQFLHRTIAGRCRNLCPP